MGVITSLVSSNIVLDSIIGRIAVIGLSFISTHVLIENSSNYHTLNLLEANMSNYINFYDKDGHYNGYCTDSNSPAPSDEAVLVVSIGILAIPILLVLLFFFIIPVGFALYNFMNESLSYILSFLS